MQENYRFNLDVDKKEESKVAVKAMYQVYIMDFYFSLIELYNIENQSH
jgi:hypothetical protein